MNYTITIGSEQLLHLSEVPKRLPRGLNGKRLHLSTIYRWIKPGCKGVRLETIKIGGTTYTSLEALQRFSDRLTAPEPAKRQVAAAPSLTQHRAVLDHRKAVKELDEEGF